MKKVSVLLLALVIVFLSKSICYATDKSINSIEDEFKKSYEKNVEEDIIKNSKVPMKKISVNPNDKEDVESFLSNYSLQPETVKSIIEYVDKCQKGKIKSNGINIYLPESVQAYDVSINISDKSFYSKTYVGYGNKTYYEEVLSYDNTSSSVPIKQGSGWPAYINTTINAIAKTGFNTGMTSITAGTWPIIKIFTAGIPTNISTNTSFRHESRLHEYKVKKFTYVVENGQYYFGSRVEMSISYFDNDVIFPGLTSTIHGNRSSMRSIIVANYNVPDKKAYYSYLNGGFVEPVYYYLYKGVYFDSI